MGTSAMTLNGTNIAWAGDSAEQVAWPPGDYLDMYGHHGLHNARKEKA